MTQNQLVKFIRLHGGKDIEVKFKSLGFYAGLAFPLENRIELDNKLPLTISWLEESLLLHEIGHLKRDNSMNKKMHKSSVMREYVAQKWALDYARDNLMYDIYVDLVNATRDWASYSWNRDGGKWRKYRLAARKLIKNGHAKLV